MKSRGTGLRRWKFTISGGSVVFDRNSADRLSIARDARSAGVRILSSQHDVYRDRNMPTVHQPMTFAPVRIGAGSDIGAGATILPGVELGDCVQVGAGAVVTRSFPADSIVAGVPAQRLDSQS